MISKQDALVLLTEMQENGLDVESDIKVILRSVDVPIEIIKKINNYRPMDLSLFYKKLKNSYNKKHSKLYINIMKSDEDALTDPNKALTTLTALLNQILQFKTEDKIMFLQHSRFDEIIKVLEIYSKTFNTNSAYKLLHLIKCDIKTMEFIQK